MNSTDSAGKIPIKARNKQVGIKTDIHYASQLRILSLTGKFNTVVSNLAVWCTATMEENASSSVQK